MKFFFSSSIALLLSIPFLAACSSNEASPSADEAGTEPDGPGNGSEVDPEDPENQPPHSLGTVILGESHGEGGTAYPFVSATFVPDARAAKSCKEKIANGCEIVRTPKCDDECEDGEVCSFDDDCAPACKKVALCSKECDEDEACTLDKFGKATCAKIETFDAGPLAFSGTTTPITLFPPYPFETDGKGAPFLAGAKITLQAQGASGAGFEAFEETFSATTFIQTKPKISKLSREDVFGTGSVPVSWVPGKDAIVVTVTGLGGSVTCKAVDADGKVEIPRRAIDAVVGENPHGAPTLAFSISRQRKETKKGLVASGELASGAVEPEGWLDLITASTETGSVQGCDEGMAACGSECVDVESDAENCGACGKACTGGGTCSAGKCGAFDACVQCQQSVRKTSCKTQWSACAAQAGCVAAADCIAKCTTNACIETCGLDPFLDAYVDYHECMATACSDACQ